MNETEINYKFDELRDETNYKLSNVNTNINSLKTRVENLEQNGGGGSNVDLTNLTQQVETNTQNIESLTNAVETNTTNITANATAIETNTQNIESLTNAVETNTTNIEANTNAIATNTQNIATNTNILNNFLSLIKDRNRSYNVPFEELDFNNTYQTYDCFERRCNITSTIFYLTPVYFNCKTGNVKIKNTLKLSAENENTSISILTYLNDVEIDAQTVMIGEEKINFEYYIDTIITDTANTLHIKVVSSATYTIYNQKSEIWANNVVIFNKPDPYQVYCYNDTYYISNCTGSTAKYCIIDKDDLHTTNDIIWTDSGIEAVELHFSAKGESFDDGLKAGAVSFCYLLTDNTCYFVNNYLNGDTAIYNQNCYTLDAMVPRTAYSIRTGIKYFSSSILYTFYYFGLDDIENDIQGSAPTSVFGDFATFRQSRFQLAKILNNSYFSGVLTRRNGDIFFFYRNKFIELPFGVRTTSYYTNKDKTTANVYINQFGQIVKCKVLYSSSVLSLLETTVIGNYDMYFEGVNNDYFTVKNDKLEYFSNDLQS